MTTRLSLRWKLLLLLWLITLIPIGLIVWLNHRSVTALADRLASSNREILVDSARRELERLTAASATRIAGDRTILELLLRHQAREIESRLAAPPPAGVPVVFADAFDDPARPPPGIGPDPRYYRVQDGNRREAQPVSFEVPVLRLGPQVQAAEVSDDVARLAGTGDFLRALHERFGDWLHWQYTSLENGVHMSYPGHGGYPRRFDPRLRPWYLQARRAGGLIWTAPAIDATTREIAMTVAMPVRRPDGSFAGVTAMDVPVPRLLRAYGLPERWAAAGRVFIVDAAATPGAGAGDALTVIARQDYAEAGGDWRTLVESRPLVSSDRQRLGTVLEDMRAGRSGTRQLPWQGADALWAWQHFAAPATCLLYIVPYAAITQAADRVRDSTVYSFQRHLVEAAPFVLAIVLGTVIVAWLSARAVTEPVQILARTADAIASGNLAARAALRTGDEFETLGRAFDNMVPKLEERLHMLESLALAREIQQRLLPQLPPQLPGLDLYGASRYCDATGGDYYDFLDLGRVRAGLAGIAVGDVSGHGLPSALMMTTVRSLLRAFTEQGHSPALALQAINAQVARDVHAGRYMTLYVALVDAGARRFCWASAGHAPALVYRPAADEFIELGTHDIPLGVDGAWRYREHRVEDWADGDVAVLATDGAWEMRDASGQMFGHERIKALVRRHHRHPARALCEELFAELDRFRGPLPLRDDVTVLVVRAA